MADKNLKFNGQCFLDLIRLLKPYWTSNEKWFAYLCLIAVIFFTIVAVESSVFLTIFNKNFFDSLVNFNKPLLIRNILYITGTIFITLLAYGYAFYFTSLLGARWQKWLTKHYITQWLANQTYYWMNYLKNTIDNPDQRITEDIAQFSTITLELFFAIFQSFLSFFSFGYILWSMSENLSFSIVGLTITLPGYLFFSAIIVSVIGIWITHLIGKKLSILNYEQQVRTANFRFSLISFRQANEEIAFHKGEMTELKKFDSLFSKIYYNFMNIVSLKKRLTFFSTGFSAGNYSLALFLATPLYLQKTIQLGGLIQATSAFTAVASAFSVFINQYSTLTQWRSIIARLSEFKMMMNRANQTVDSKLIIEKHTQDSIIIDNLTLLLPNGKKLLDKINLSFCAGGSFLIRGAAGLGKSTLLRAIAGLWPHGIGRIQLPKAAKIFFLPQKIYLPMDSLRNILVYPNSYKVDDNSLTEYLKLFGLQKLQAKLDEVKPWSQTLSLGEQQLISHIKLFLYKPDIIFLDEATSALDEAMEATFYTNLRLHLPKTTFISVGHKRSLNKFHDSIILLNPILS